MSETINKIIHGDCRDYLYKIKTPVNCVITDPPYGMNFTSNQAQRPESLKFTEKIAGDGDINKALDLFDEVMRAVIPKLAPQADLYIFTAWHILDRWIPAVKKYPQIEFKQMLVWSKGDPGMGDLEANWGCGHEIILYLKKGRRPVKFRRQAIIHVDKVQPGKNIHPTEKPVSLLQHLIEMSTDPGDLIVDPFSGSGSTSLAAKLLKRNSLAFEIDERWVGPSQERLKQTGLF